MRKRIRIEIIITIVILAVIGAFIIAIPRINIGEPKVLPLVLPKGGIDKSQITGLHGHLTDLQLQIDDLQSDNTIIEQQVNDLHTAYVDAQLQITHIEAENVNLQEKVKKMYNKIVEKVISILYDYKKNKKREAAENGNASAQNSLGFMYCMGQWVDQDYNEAAEWFLKAAEQEHVQAQFNLGVMHSDGQ